jgi:ATP-dependent protease ClpP protease subunit
MKTFLIAGSIVDTDADRETFEDVTPVQINAFLNKLEPNEEALLEITSYGGSVTAGLAICNLLKQASANGHKTTSHVIGIAASMASAIACACDELKIDANAFLMVHNPWTMTMGNAIDLRKEADTLDKYRDALLAVYRTKFNTSDEVIKKMLDDETWIIGIGSPMFELNAEVIPTQEPLRAAAFAKAMPKFMHTPKALKEIIMEKEEEIKQANDEVKNEEVVETKADETPAEPVVEEPKAEVVEETPKVEEPVEEMVAKAEVDKRVSGMQSAMAKQMDAMKKDYEAKIADFQVQIKAKDEELAKVKAEATSLVENLDKANKELSEMTSALVEKTNALDALNAGVNTPNQTDMKPWAKLHGEELLKWCRENQARKY